MASSPDPRRAPAVLLGVLLLFTYAYFVAPPSWNENSRFDLTRSIVERGRLDIDPYHHNTGDKSFRDGHHYSDKAPGASFLAVPVYAAYYGYLRASGGGLPNSLPTQTASDDEPDYLVNLGFRRALYLCSVATAGVAGAVLGVLFFLHLCARGVPARAALAATTALSLGSLILPYATMFYGHVIAAALLFASYFAVARDGLPSTRRMAAAGALAGAAVLAELPAAGAMVVLAVFALWRCTGARARAVWFAVGAAAPLAMLLAYQLAAFGSPFRAGYALVSRPEFAEGMSRGVMGVGVPRPRVVIALLFGRARGLFYVFPVLALAMGALVANVALRARRTPEALVAAALVVFFVLLNAGYYMWHGGSALGPRHLIPALPFLCLALPAVLRGRWRLAFAALLAVSVVNGVIATAVQPAAPLVRDVLRDHVYAYFLAGEVGVAEGATNLGRLVGLAGPLTLLPLVVVWGLAMRVLWPLLPTTSGEGIIAAANRGAEQPSASP